MLCEKCKQREATAHIRQSINGVQSEMHLCESCAAELSGKFENEYSKIFSDFGFGIDSMLGSIFGQDFVPEKLISDNSERCPMCSTSLSTIRKTGKAGCSKCYEVFRTQFMPLISRIHGKTVHNGRIPTSAQANIAVKSQIDELEKNLKQAIETQEFEKAAKIRDELNELRKSL